MNQKILNITQSLAVALEPFSQRIQKWGLSKRTAIALIAAVISVLIASLATIIIPSIFSQTTHLISLLPTLKDDLLNEIPENSALKSTIESMLNSPKIPDSSVIMGRALEIFNRLFESITQLFLILIFSIYLLSDGKRAFRWISDFFKAPTRIKLQRTANETSKVIYGYALGQVVTSLAAALAAFAILKTLQVPGAFTLSILAGLFAIIPIAGFFMALIPALLLALTVSPTCALIVLALYVIYHQIETYLLAPYVYGNSLQISGLVVLIALLIAGSIGGILFAIAILPVVASYPIIERIWLVKYLGRQVVEKHSDDARNYRMPEQAQMWANDSQHKPRMNAVLAIFDAVPTYRKRILIVEDDPDIRSILQDILETEGYEVLVASNGKDALQADQRFEKIPVIFLSGSVNAQNTHGAAGVLVKPSEIDVVLDIVDKHYRDPIE